MEDLLHTLKSVLLLPVGALLYLPFLRLAARFMALKRLSFGAAFMLGLVLGAVLLLAGLVIDPLFPEQTLVTIVVLTALSLAISSAVCGYLVSTVDGTSVGLVKGFYFTLISQVLFAVAFMIIAGLLALIFVGWKT
jgi:hypothetical protein